MANKKLNGVAFSVVGIVSSIAIIAYVKSDNFQSYIKNNEEKARYEQDRFDAVITHADRNNDGVLQLTETSRMLNEIEYKHVALYEGQSLDGITYSRYKPTSLNYKYTDNSGPISITLNVSDLEKYVKVEMPDVHLQKPL